MGDHVEDLPLPRGADGFDVPGQRAAFVVLVLGPASLAALVVVQRLLGLVVPLYP